MSRDEFIQELMEIRNSSRISGASEVAGNGYDQLQNDRRAFAAISKLVCWWNSVSIATNAAGFDLRSIDTSEE